jgi:branched-chain amino acid transport system substrate-binding protein
MDLEPKMDRKQNAPSVGKEVSRREFLKIAGVAGAVVGLGAGMGGLVTACGGEETTTTSATVTSASTTEASTATTSGATTTVSASAETGPEIKLGVVTPTTGGLATFGVADSYCVDRAKEAVGDGLICGDGKKHPINFLVRDSQSDTNRAAQVAGDLIMNDKVNLMMAASTADTTNPVADQCESAEMPCITTDCPWQNYVYGRTNTYDAVFKWTYNVFWGTEDVIATYSDMWNQVDTNKKVGEMLVNDANGNPWVKPWADAMPKLGYTATVTSQPLPGTEDFTAQIGDFKKAGCEIAFGMLFPPDFVNFWKESAQQGWQPKIVTYAVANMFPQAVEAQGDMGNRLCCEQMWSRTHPFTSPLLGESCAQFADEFEKRKNMQWTPPLFHFVMFEWAIDVLKRATDLTDKNAILEAIKATKMDTIGGPIDFTAPIDGWDTPKIGPSRPIQNHYKTPLVGGQWIKTAGGKYPYELVTVSNAAAPMVPLGGKVEPLVY